MRSKIRNVSANTPFRLIAVVLLAVLVPSVLVTALGLVAVFLADAHVSESFRRPFREPLQELEKALTEAWHRRLVTYETYLQGAGRDGVRARTPYLARLRERDPAVREVVIAAPSTLHLVDPEEPRRLGDENLPLELRTLHELEFSRKDPSGALVEARRLLGSETTDEVQIEALLAAARLSERLGRADDALEYLRWALDRFGHTVTELGVVRAVPILLRMAEIERGLASSEAFLMRLPKVTRALHRYSKYMLPDTVEFFEARLEALAGRGHRAHTKLPRSAAESGQSLRASDLEEIADRLRLLHNDAQTSSPSYLTIAHSRRGRLDFVGFRDEEADLTTYLLLDPDDFMIEARTYAEMQGLSAARVDLRFRAASSDGRTSEAAFAIGAPPPFETYEIVYTSPPGSSPEKFLAFNVVSLATFTWAVILSVLTIFVGVAFTLRAVLRELQTARLKTDFVSFVTHELKTPLTAIRMYAETMLAGRVEEAADQRMCVRIIDQESQRLMHLIDQILEYSKLERRQKKFQFVSCDMIAVVNEAVRIFHEHYQDRPRAVEINSAQHVSKIRMDRAAMIELLLNLLSNAAKYSASETAIVVNLRESITEISVEVVDRGVGIRKRDQKKIFDRFHRADDFLTREVDGTGLGLTFARYIAKVHNGDIKVTSQVGGGSSFTLFLRKTHVLAE